MTDNPYAILGIAPTSDERVIRAAFLRLAQIYHPDRFAGLADDIRIEAERRMKEITAAYHALRVIMHLPAPRPTMSEEELEKLLAERRKEIAVRRAEQDADRVRWHRWEDLERRARERAQMEDELFGAVTRPHYAQQPARPEAVPQIPMTRQSLLARRLEEARKPRGSIPA
ncbi:MAG: DnaJ domain-containing protein [Actinomycetota bacterium]|nr:DnaJ domain-containing protein [Actinomycetota bacterium]